jgi:acyl-coenzyme A thioesterase PaaI-like protein
MAQVLLRGANIRGVTAFQDLMHDNFCWGCGADNPDGLQIKTVWDGDTSRTRWTSSPQFAAGPKHILNGGIIATLLDCHGVVTAIADRYRSQDREIGTGPEIWCATAKMAVEYLRPTPIDAEVELRGTVGDVDERFSTIEVVLAADGKDRARATVHAVLVPESWRHGSPG